MTSLVPTPQCQAGPVALIAEVAVPDVAETWVNWQGSS